MSRRLKDFDEALEAYRLGEEVEYAMNGLTGWQPMFRKLYTTPPSIAIDEPALGYCVNYRTKPEPRVQAIMEEVFEVEPPGKGRQNWRSVKGAKRAVREALREVRKCSGALTGYLDKELTRIEHEFCGKE